MFTELKLMDLARRVYEMNVGETIDFANGDAATVEWYGGWCGIKRIDPFDNDNLMYLVGHYGGECNTILYNISEFDPRIGDFCEKRVKYLDAESEIECIAKMLADFILWLEDAISATITIDEEV